MFSYSSATAVRNQPKQRSEILLEAKMLRFYTKFHYSILLSELIVLLKSAIIMGTVYVGQLFCQFLTNATLNVY